MFDLESIQVYHTHEAEKNIDQIIKDDFSARSQKIIQDNPYLKESLETQWKTLDKYGFDHVTRVTRKAEKLSEELGLDDSDSNTLIQASMLHDFGKADDKIKYIFQSEKKFVDFTNKDIENQQRHVIEKKEWMEENNIPFDVFHIVLAHHEPKYRRKKNDRREDDFERRREISENLKYLTHIFSLIDKSDAIMNKRSYKEVKNPLECEDKLRKYFTNDEDAHITQFLIENNE